MPVRINVKTGVAVELYFLAVKTPITWNNQVRGTSGLDEVLSQETTTTHSRFEYLVDYNETGSI